MPSLRAPGRSPAYGAIAHVLIAALTATALPTAASASIPAAEAERLTKTAFGELLSHSGSDTQPYAFAGEPLDPNVGFQYHRARWMDPRVGRFIAMDPFGGDPFEPQSLHRFQYSSNDPVARVDPTGEFDISVAAVLSLLSMMTTINAMAVPSSAAAMNSVRPRTVYLRSFAPWPVFGGGFEGDNRTFSTIHDGTVTARITGIVDYFLAGGVPVVTRSVSFSDVSRHPRLGTARGVPSISTSTSGRQLHIEIAGKIPLTWQGLTPSINVKTDINLSESGGSTCYSGRMYGDAFPNAELFVLHRGAATMVHTFGTSYSAASGPLEALPRDDNDRPMGGFSKCVAQ